MVDDPPKIAGRYTSTFEITDKVYDRAQVLNFKNRAKGRKLDKDIEKKFISYGTLKALFDRAKKEYEFDCASNPAIIDIDNYLKEHFNVSFGNRILDQINKFVPVYVAASFVSKPKNESEKERFIYEALDYQITNKVLRKLEYIDMSKDDAEAFQQFLKDKKYNLKMAQEFFEAKKDR